MISEIDIMRIDLSKIYGNSVLFHGAVSHKYQSLNSEKLIGQTSFKDTSGLNIIICHNKFA